jgi:hypothetical protein
MLIPLRISTASVTIATCRGVRLPTCAVPLVSSSILLLAKARAASMVVLLDHAFAGPQHNSLRCSFPCLLLARNRSGFRRPFGLTTSTGPAFLSQLCHSGPFQSILLCKTHGFESRMRCQWKGRRGHRGELTEKVHSHELADGSSGEMSTFSTRKIAEPNARFSKSHCGLIHWAAQTFVRRCKAICACRSFTSSSLRKPRKIAGCLVP